MNNILVLFGSPNKKGNTNKLVDVLLESVDKSVSIDRVDLVDNKINYCMGCNKCLIKPYNCIFDDDMTEIYNKIEKADVIILASPIYFNSVTSFTKTMIDRCQRFFNMKVKNKIVFKSKKGVLISTAGSVDENSFDALKNISKYFFLSINAKLEYELLINNTDKCSINKENMIKAEKIGKSL